MNAPSSAANGGGENSERGRDDKQALKQSEGREGDKIGGQRWLLIVCNRASKGHLKDQSKEGKK